MRNRILVCSGILVAAVWMVGCSGEKAEKDAQSHDGQHADQSATPGLKAIAQLNPTEGNSVQGTVTYTQEANGVRVVAHLTGLTPGKHGWHIHEKGDCSAPDATSAGAHYNPDSMPHAGPHAQQRHAGDMGNLEADSTGMAHLEYLDETMRLQGPNSVIGRAVIIHAGEDDLTTQPTGNSGARVACGVIESSKS